MASNERNLSGSFDYEALESCDFITFAEFFINKLDLRPRERCKALEGREEARRGSVMRFLYLRLGGY